MAIRLLEDDPEAAYQHAMAAQHAAGRIGAVREAAGVAAYAAGHYAEALAQLRTARRITGAQDYLPLMADCERGLGRPERALTLATSPEAQRLDRAGQVEMRIVAAGARRDMGQLDAAVVTLQGPDLVSREAAPWSARLRYAYADALLAAGRRAEALDWFRRAADVDGNAETDAEERVTELEGVSFLDLEEDEFPPSDGDDEERVAAAPPADDEDRSELPLSLPDDANDVPREPSDSGAGFHPARSVELDEADAEVGRVHFSDGAVAEQSADPDSRPD